MSDVVTTLSATRRRILTFALAAFGTVLFLALGLPLPFLFGPMAACLIAALAHVPIKGFGQVSLAARTILGVAVGASIPPALFAELPRMVTSIALVPLFIANLVGPGIDVTGRMTFLSLDPAIRTRLTTIYVVIMFIGGGLGSSGIIT